MTLPESNPNAQTAHRETFVDDRLVHPVAAQPAEPEADAGLRREDVVALQRRRFGGVKVGSAFFGWLTATGMTVILTALLAGAGAAVGVATGTDVGTATSTATANPATVGLAGAIALGVIVLLAYFCGGYVAGRMARFSGATQGAAVWVWAVIVAIVVAIVGAAAGGGYDILSRVNTFPRIPVGQGDLTTAGITALVIAALVSLIGSLLGGLAGMRYHRAVDRAGLEA